MQARLIALYVAVFFIVSLIIGLQLSGDNYLRGPDAYYYALQADHWAQTGEVKIPDSSYIHRLHGLLQRSGMNTESAIRLWSVSLCFLLSVMMLFFLSASLKSFYAISALAWLAISPSILFVVIEFPKLFTFLLILPLVMYLLRRTAPQNIWAVIPAGIAVFIHKAAIPISSLLAAGLFIVNYSMWQQYRRVLLVLFAVLAVMLISYIGMGDRFHLLDLQRLGGLNQLSPGYFTLLGRDSLPLLIKIELVVSLLVFVSVVIFYVRSQESDFRILLYPFALILPGFFPFSSIEVFGIGERYAILLPFMFVLSSVFLLSLKPYTEMNLKTVFLLPLLFLLLAPVLFRLDYSHPGYLDPDNGKYEKISHRLEQESIPMLIVHRGFNFYYKYKTRNEAFHYEPEPHWDKTKIWRLTYRITAEELEYYLPQGCKWDSGKLRQVADNEYFLIREDCWATFRSTVDIDINPDLHARIWDWWRNPSQARPAFLYKKHINEPASDKDPFSALPS